MTDTKQTQRLRRRKRVRAKVVGTPARPRLAVFRSNRYLSAQLIDDTTGTTLAAARTGTGGAGSPYEVGKAIAEGAAKENITQAVFDRGGFRYTGNVQKVAEGAREAGLTI